MKIKKVQRKLCFVIPSLQAGGMERVMSELVNYISAKNDVEVHLVLYGISREIFYKVSDKIIIHEPLFTFNNNNRFLSTIRTLFYLRKIVKQINPQSVLSFGEFWNNFVLLSLLGLKYPIYISDRSQPDKSLGRFHDILRKWLYPTSKGLILQTQKAKEIYLRNSRHNNITVIGNPIRSIVSEDRVVTREKIVLMVGRLIKSKNQDKLIEMFAKVSPPDWKLLLVGYDHLKQNNLERLQQLASDLHIREQVVFAGKQDEMDQIYLKSSIFAFTSSSEGFPNVIGEAMSAGLPVISYDCIAGPSDMITDGYDGFLIPLFDSTVFEKRLFGLIENEKLRKELGSNAKKSIKRFSADKICEEFYQCIFR